MRNRKLITLLAGTAAIAAAPLAWTQSTDPTLGSGTSPTGSSTTEDRTMGTSGTSSTMGTSGTSTATDTSGTSTGTTTGTTDTSGTSTGTTTGTSDSSGTTYGTSGTSDTSTGTTTGNSDSSGTTYGSPGTAGTSTGTTTGSTDSSGTTYGTAGTSGTTSGTSTGTTDSSGTTYGATDSSGNSGTATGTNSTNPGYNAGATTGSSSNASSTAGLQGTDATFLQKAIEGGREEVQNAQNAMRSAQRAEVRNSASMMLEDHTRSNEKLEQLASRKGWKLPAAADMAESDQSRLGSGAAFDDNYLEQEIRHHRETISLYRAQASSGTDPELRQFAQDALPTLEHHLEMLQGSHSAK